MTENSIQTMTHDECQLSLPAYIHGQLNSDESRAVQNHIAHCEECFDLQQEALSLRDGLASPPVDIETLLNSSRMEENLQNTLNKIDELESNLQVEKSSSLFSWFNSFYQQWQVTPISFKTVVLAQACSLFLLLGGFAYVYNLPEVRMMLMNGESKMYNTLSDADKSPAANYAENDYQVYRIVFHGAATEQDIRSLLNSIEAQMISGPSVAGVYTVATMKDKQQEHLILNSLRSSPWIKLAEPIVYTSQEQ